jgi:oligopeptide/dipeptide ABC transporter ATP-binding protein
MGESLLQISDLAVDYKIEDYRVRALDKVNFQIPSKGYKIGVVGGSGSGKSTLGMAIMNSIELPGKISSGKIEFDGTDVLGLSKRELRDYRWKQVSLVFQSAMNSLNPVKPVSDPIIEVLVEHTGASKSEARERAIDLLTDVGIEERRVNDYPHQFSGGMRQRVAIALAMALSPQLLIADEPTSALDVVTQRQILALLKKKVSERNMSLMFITHEISLLLGLVDHVVVMYRGQVAEIGPVNKVLFEPMHPYTEVLVKTVLSFKSTTDTLTTASRTGSKRSSLPIESSCIYNDNCKYAFERCKQERPLLRQVADDRWVACHKFS